MTLGPYPEEPIPGNTTDATKPTTQQDPERLSLHEGSLS